MPGEIFRGTFDVERKPGEECGIFGIYDPDGNAVASAQLGLSALQHRGQEGAGIAVSGETGIVSYKDHGLVREAFRGNRLSGLPSGIFATGHVRYATHAVGNSRRFDALQPIIGNSPEQGVEFTLSHNGHIELDVSESNEHITDSGFITGVIAKGVDKYSLSLAEGVAESIKQLKGAYSLVIMGKKELIGLRDPKGFRPLMLGKLANGGSVLASERGALDIVNAKFTREVEAGEMVVINSLGVFSHRPFPPQEVDPKLCAFEFIYFSRPDAVMETENVEEVRIRLGARLAEHHPAEDADVVIGVPESGSSAAHGYAQASGLPLVRGLVKNNYVGRSFIESQQLDRDETVAIKLNPIEKLVAGRRIVVIDDSIVRGTTTRQIVNMLRQAGAVGVDVRISSPPYKWPCFYGMDTGNINELIAATKSKEEIRQVIGADSLEYLAIQDLQQALGSAAGKVCMACMSGQYPTPVPEERLRIVA